MAAQLGPFAVPGYYVGDCRELLRQLPDGCINCCVTSPPYWGLRDYGEPGQLGLEPTPAEYVANLLDVFREVRRVLRDDGTLWLNLGDCYATGAGKVGDCPGGGEQGARWVGDSRGYRGERLANGRGDEPAILRKKSVGRGFHTEANSGKAAPRLAVMGPMTQPNRMPLPGLKPKDLVGIPWRVAFALQADGWWLRSDIIWSKTAPMPESVQDRPTTSHEHVFLLTKAANYYYNAEAVAEPAAEPERQRCDRIGGASGHEVRHSPGGMMGASTTRNRRSVWTIGPEASAEAHFAVMPRALAQPCILAGCPAGGIVVDPFGGSGTTGRVAEDNGRQWILFDLSSKYAEIAKRKTAQTGLLGRVGRAD